MLDTLLGLNPHAGSGWVNKSPDDDYWYHPRGMPTASGVPVSEETAMTFSTVYACVSKLAKTISTLPGSVSERVSETERHRVDNPLNNVLTLGTNGDGSGISAREAMIANLLLWGMGYGEITWTNGMQPKMISPLLSRDVSEKFDDDRTLYYEVKEPSGQTRRVEAANMLAVPGLTFNGLTGLSVVGFQREAIGLGMAASKFGSSFYGNGAQVGGFLELPEGKKMSAEAENRLVDRFNEKHQGSLNAFKVAMLRDGLTYTQLSMPLRDSQFLELRQFQRIEICSIFDVPPSKIQDLDKATFSNFEQQNLGWVTDSLLPLAVRFETAVNRKFFPDEPLRWRHNLAGLLRGDLKSRYAAYAIGRQWGWLSANDIRLLEDMNAIEGGDEYLVPLNMIPADEPRDEESQPPAAFGITTQPIAIEDKRTVGQMIEPLCQDAAERIVTKECKAVMASFKRRSKEETSDGFDAWCDKFYTQLQDSFTSAVTPILLSVPAAVGGTDAVRLWAKEYCQEHLDQLTSGDSITIPGWIEDWKERGAIRLSISINEKITKLTEK
jgi:HK97 family phage portal protein